MINNLIKWSTLEDLLRLKGNHWQLRTFISHPVDSGYNVSVFTTQGNRLGFYERLGEYEARPSYRWERLHHDEEIKMKLKMDIIVLKRRDLGPIQIHLSTFDHFQTTERRLLPVLQFSKASLGGSIIIITKHFVSVFQRNVLQVDDHVEQSPVGNKTLFFIRKSVIVFQRTNRMKFLLVNHH